MHHPSTHPLYQTWYGMLCRCENPSHHSYPHYGGRGIRVCERWHDFDLFVADMGAPPGDGFSMDRIDVNGGYEPGNVRWATHGTQMRNRRPRQSVTLPPLRALSCAAHGQLRSWLAEHKIPQRHFAASLGLSAASLSVWLSGGARPEHHFRLAVERLTSIPALDWLTDAEWLLAFGAPRLQKTG